MTDEYVPSAFVRDMTAGFSFSQPGSSFGTAGTLAGTGMDLLWKSLWPNRPLVQDIGSQFDQHRVATNILALKSFKEQMQSVSSAMMSQQLQNFGLPQSLSNLGGMVAGVAGINPFGVSKGGTLSMAYAGADPSRSWFLDKNSMGGMATAFQSYFNYDYMSREAGPQRTDAYADMLQRTGGLRMDDAAKSLAVMRYYGGFNPNIDPFRKRAFSEIGRLTEGAGITEDMTVGQRLEAVRGDTGYENLVKKYGRTVMERAVGDNEVSPLARSMQLEDAYSPGWGGQNMLTALKAFKTEGFGGDLGELIQFISSQFGQEQALNPEFIKSVAADIRATKEALKLSFDEAKNFISVMGSVSGTENMTDIQRSTVAGNASILFSEASMPGVSAPRRMALAEEFMGAQSDRLASPASLMLRTAAAIGTADDISLLENIQSLQGNEQVSAIQALARGGTYNGMRWSESVQGVTQDVFSTRFHQQGVKRANLIASSMQSRIDELEGMAERSLDQNAELKDLKKRQSLMTGVGKAAYASAVDRIHQGALGGIEEFFEGDVDLGIQLLGASLQGQTPEQAIAEAQGRGLTVTPEMGERFRKGVAGLLGDVGYAANNIIGAKARMPLTAEMREKIVRQRKVAAAMGTVNVDRAIELSNITDPEQKKLLRAKLESGIGINDILGQFGLSISTTTGDITTIGERKSVPTELGGNIIDDPEMADRLKGIMPGLVGTAAGAGSALNAVTGRGRLSDVAINKRIIGLNDALKTATGKEFDVFTKKDLEGLDIHEALKGVSGDERISIFQQLGGINTMLKARKSHMDTLNQARGSLMEQLQTAGITGVTEKNIDSFIENMSIRSKEGGSGGLESILGDIKELISRIMDMFTGGFKLDLSGADGEKINVNLNTPNIETEQKAATG